MMMILNDPSLKSICLIGFSEVNDEGVSLNQFRKNYRTSERIHQRWKQHDQILNCFESSGEVLLCQDAVCTRW